MSFGMLRSIGVVRTSCPKRMRSMITTGGSLVFQTAVVLLEAGDLGLIHLVTVAMISKASQVALCSDTTYHCRPLAGASVVLPLFAVLVFEPVALTDVVEEDARVRVEFIWVLRERCPRVRHDCLFVTSLFDGQYLCHNGSGWLGKERGRCDRRK